MSSGDIDSTEKMSVVSKNSLVIAGIFAAGLAVGILTVVSIQNVGKRNEHLTQDVARVDVGQTSTERADNRSSKSTHIAGQFEEIFNQRSTAEQYKALYNTLSRTNEQELKEWWIQSKNIERTSRREIAQQVVLRNLSKINPETALQYVNEVSFHQTDALSRTIFSEWAVSDIDDAIKAASKLLGARRSVALDSILETRDDLSEDRRLAIAVQLNRIDTLDKLNSEMKALHSIADPSSSWDILLNDNVDDSLQIGALALVAEQWQGQIGFEVLSKIYHSGFEDFEIKRLLLEAIAQVDPAQALEFAREVSDENEQSFLSGIIVEEWASTDPLAALAAVSSFKPASLYFDLEEEIGVVWAKNKPYEFIQSIELMSEGSRVWPLEVAFAYLTREDPLGAIESLSSMKDYVGNTTTILHRIIEQWGMLQPEVATNWILNDFDQEDPYLRYSLLEETLPSLALQDPQKAFEIALEQPTPDHGLAFGLDFRVISELAWHGRVEHAIDLLPRARESSKASAYESVGKALVDKGQGLDALELGSDLKPNQQQRYYRSIIQRWAWADPTELYEALEDLPSSDAQSLQSIAASELLTRRFSRHQVLTDEQLERARSFLNDNDRKRVQLIERLENQ